MNEFQLRCFLAVADTLSFARAAEQMHVTQPAVTQQIHSLEKELNARLFYRTTRTVRMTEEGKLFLHDAHHIVRTVAQAKNRFKDPDKRGIQTLSVGCYSTAHLFLLPPVIRRLKERYPGLRPQLQGIPFQHLYRQLDEGEVDAVIGFREPETRKISGQYRELTKVPVVCACAADHPLAQRTAVTVEELKKEKMVLFDPVRAHADIALLQGQLVGGRPLSEFYFCESAEAVLVLVQAGLGVSIMPDLFIPPTLHLARLSIQEIEPVSFGIYYKSLQGNAPLKSLIQFLREEMDLRSGTAHGGESRADRKTARCEAACEKADP